MRQSRLRAAGRIAPILLLVASVLATSAASPFAGPAAGLHANGGTPAPAPAPYGKAVAAATTPPSWQSFSVPAAFPGLFYPSLAPDPFDNYTVLFGGCNGAVSCATSASNATWLYSDGTWQELNLSVHPSARGEAEMAWDPTDDYVLLFGGTGCQNPPACSQSGPLDDTWAFSGGHWSQITISGTTPPASEEGGMAFDPSTQQVILFGSYACFTGCGTWSYSGGTWTEMNLSAPPPYRYGEGLAEDDADHGALLFGGISANGTYLSDTWLYTAGKWRQLFLSPSPAQRVDTTMGWDSALGAVVLFGGAYITASNFPGVTYDDTWLFLGGRWVQPLVGTPTPGARWEAGGAEDPSSGVFVLTGGCGGGGCPYADTWGLGASYVVRLTSPQGSCVTVTISGTAHAVSNQSLTLENASYPLTIVPCAGTWIEYVNGTGGVGLAVSANNSTRWVGELEVRGAGTLQVTLVNVPTQPVRKASGLPLPLPLLLGIVAVIAVVAIAAAALLLRRKPPTPSATPTADAQGPVGPAAAAAPSGEGAGTTAPPNS